MTLDDQLAIESVATFAGKDVLKASGLSAARSGRRGSLAQRGIWARFKQGGDTALQLARWYRDKVYDHQKQVASTLAVAHQAPIRVRGGVADSDEWEEIKADANLLQALRKKDLLAQANGSCGITVAWSNRGDIPVFAAVPRSHLRAIKVDAALHTRVLAIEELMGPIDKNGSKIRVERTRVWDISDPDEPVYAIYKNEGDHLKGRPPLHAITGVDYPWRNPDNGDPWLDYRFYTGKPPILAALPVNGLAQLTHDFNMWLTWLLFPAVIRGWELPIAWGEEKISGLDKLIASPAAAAELFGTGMKGIGAVSDATAATATQYETWESLVRMSLKESDPNISAKGSDAAMSGLALSIIAGHEEQVFTDLAGRYAPDDARLLQIYAVTWNFMVEAGMLDRPLLPTDLPTVTHERVRHGEERRRTYQDARQDMIDGWGSPVAVQAAKDGLDVGDDSHKQIAVDMVEARREERTMFKGVLPGNDDSDTDDQE